MIVAIDGPAASGKGTLAKRLAAHYGLPHLDTGLLYRAVALALIRAGRTPDDAAAAEAAARDLRAGDLDDPRLRERAMGEAASRVSGLSAVRAALLDWQRRFAGAPGGAVLDGRDIGTVVCPGADVKLYVTASAEERARRRHRELVARGEATDAKTNSATGSTAGAAAGSATDLDAILADILARDARDSGRAVAPLRTADDAVVLDTTALDVDAAFRAALAIIGRSINAARMGGE